MYWMVRQVEPETYYIVLTECTNATVTGGSTLTSNIGFLYSEGSTNVSISNISFSYPANNKIYFGSGSEVKLSNLRFGSESSSESSKANYVVRKESRKGEANSNEAEQYAVFVSSVDSVSMENCEFYSQYTGCAGFHGSSEVTVSSCTFSGNKLGVQPNLYRSYDSSSSQYAAMSLLIWGASTATVTSCVFESNEVALENWGMYADYVSSNGAESKLSASANSVVVQTEQRSGDVIIGNTTTCTMSGNRYEKNVLTFEDTAEEWQYVVAAYKDIAPTYVNLVHFEMNRQAASVLFVEGTGSVSMVGESVSEHVGGFVCGESLSSFEMKDSTLENITTKHESLDGAAMTIGVTSSGSVTLTNVSVSDVKPHRSESVIDNYEFIMSGFESLVPTWNAKKMSGSKRVWRYGADEEEVSEGEGKYKIRQESSESEFGGAIVIKCGKGKISSSSFKNVSANGYGGALLMRGATSVEISNTEFDSCEAGVSGGAIAIEQESLSDVSVNVSGCNFTSCTSGKLGGAIYMPVGDYNSESMSAQENGGFSISMEMSNVQFSSCYAGEGGAVYYSQRENTTRGEGEAEVASVTYTVKNGKFTNCGATYGGGMYTGVSQYESSISLTSVNASSCESYLSGGICEYEQQRSDEQSE